MRKQSTATAAYYAEKGNQLRIMLRRTKILLPDFLKLPTWVKEDLLQGWGSTTNPQKIRECKVAQDRLWEQGLKLSTYTPGDPFSLFPKGLLRKRMYRINKTSVPQPWKRRKVNVEEGTS